MGVDCCVPATWASCGYANAAYAFYVIFSSWDVVAIWFGAGQFNAAPDEVRYLSLSSVHNI